MESLSDPIDGQGSGDGTSEIEGVKLFIPNAFSPNEDGINDVYFINNANFEVFDFNVFDRWGNPVFQSNNPEFRWDGRVRGKKVPSGVYVFVFTGITRDKLNIRRSGNISVIY